MTPATARRARSARQKLLVMDERGIVSHHGSHEFAALLRAGDLVVANDAATLPASLRGVHLPTGAPIEVRLTGCLTLSPDAMTRFTAVVFGAGDYRTPTERREAPPTLAVGDVLVAGSLRARVVAMAGHQRRVELYFEHSSREIWEGLARHGRPIQYAHVPQPLALWDTWASVAAQPVTFEAPSAGFMLDWSMLDELRRRGVRFATLTHAAGISSTGDADLDARLPFEESYVIPATTAELVEPTRANGGRVVAVGTTVVRALEDAALETGHVRAGAGLATGRIGPLTTLRVVDAIVSGMHEPDTSHFELLHAFQTRHALEQMSMEAEAHDYRTHEFGDVALIVKAPRQER
jgi:S-adenosylmethionine:tRNA ribosyltransferase-isomerase